MDAIVNPTIQYANEVLERIPAVAKKNTDPHIAFTLATNEIVITNLLRELEEKEAQIAALTSKRKFFRR